MSIASVNETIRAIEKVVLALNHLGISYFVCGSVASSLRGEFRATHDIDIVCFLSSQQVDPFVSALGDDFFADIFAVASAVREQRSFNIIEKASCLKVDVFTKIGDFEQAQLKRATLVRLPGTELLISVATAEDTVISKLVWFRKGNEVSDQQWRDILGVLAISGPALDHIYMKHWAEKLDVSDLLDRALTS